MVNGDDRERNTSSANAATLVSTSPDQTPLIFMFRLIYLRKGSSDIIKISGERGEPWACTVGELEMIRQRPIHFHPGIRERI